MHGNGRDEGLQLQDRQCDLVGGVAGERGSLLVFDTTSAILEICSPSNDRCNVCGAAFQPLPFFHFMGNMFSTNCDYVRNLLPPGTFEIEMNNIAGDALREHLDMNYTAELFQLSPRTLGLEQHSVEHWIAEHPDLKPCSASSIDSEQSGKTNDGNEFHLELEARILDRDAYHLVESLFRIHRLYNKLPDRSSWLPFNR